MSPLSLIAVLLLVLIAAALILAVRASPSSQIGRLRQRFFPPPPPNPNTGVTIIESNGEEYVPPEEAPPPRLSERIRDAGLRRQRVLVALLALIVVLAGWQIFRLTSAPTPEQFVVLVAPFREPGGTVGQTGREVASALVAGLPEASGQRVIARLLDDAPADSAAALQALNRERADALVWGEITAGGVVDRETLRPQLTYRPSGTSTPLAWDGYAGRFAMPTEYTLASSPLNGARVLPSLLGALADYQAGHLNSAFTILGELTNSYPTLVPTLPRALRGNILWARGEFQQAIEEYQAAIRAINTTDERKQAALLINNLGAIQQDAGDAGATASFNDTIKALEGGDLSALRYNLALQNLRDNNSKDAVTSLEIARTPSLLGSDSPPVPMLLALSEAYRQNGQFGQARAALEAAQRGITIDTNSMAPESRNSARARLSADTGMEQVLIDLSQSANARGPLEWELLGSDALTSQQLDAIRKNLAKTVDDTAVVGQLWTRLATAKDASGDPVAGQVAISQAQRAQAQLRVRQRWLALVELERGSVQGVRAPSNTIASIWAAIAGDRSPAGQGRAILQDLLNSQPGDVDTIVLLGNIELLNSQPDNALTQFNKAAALAPDRAEPVYGQALAHLAKSERDTARQLLNQAIAIKPAFFPARQRLIALAEEDQDWQTVVVQRRWFAENRPSDANTLALAEALRKTDDAGKKEAEALLLPLANNNNVGAMVALSRLYQQNNDPDGARQSLERAQQAAPTNSSVAFEYGKLLEEQEKPDEALTAYQHAVELDTTNTQAHLALGRLYASKGLYNEAGAQYGIALRAGADDPQELKDIGNVLLKNGEYSTAADAFDQAITARTAANPAPLADGTDPNALLADLYHGRGQANLKQDKLTEAQADELRALELRNNNFAAALVGLGDVALQSGNPKGASDRYNAALQLESISKDERVAANIGLGRASGAQEQWTVAQAHFNDAISADPGSPEAHLWLGEALIRQPNPPAAIDAYVAALKLRENRYPEAYFGLAQAQAADGRPDLAQENLALALQLKPGYPEALLLQGKLYEQQGNRDAALASYSKAINTSDKLAEPYYRRAMLYVRASNLDSAAGDLQSAIDIQNNFSEAHYWLGRVYLAQGKTKDARSEFVTAISNRNGDFADARFYQGLAEEQLGQRTEAVQSYETALEQNANGEWAGEARTALARLKQQ